MYLKKVSALNAGRRYQSSTGLINLVRTFVSTSAKASLLIWSKIPLDFNSSTRVLTKSGSFKDGTGLVESAGFESIVNH